MNAMLYIPQHQPVRNRRNRARIILRVIAALSIECMRQLIDGAFR